MCFAARRKKLGWASALVLWMEAATIDRVLHTKFLGVFVDESLNWKFHASQVSLKISKSLGVLTRVRSILSQKLLVTLYYTMIHPYFLYCHIIWGGASELALHKLVCIQKRALRINSNSPFRTPSGPLFASLNILRLRDINRLALLMYMYRVKFVFIPKSFAVKVITSHINHNHGLRYLS